jgi:cardiolipin synthase A/B
MSPDFVGALWGTAILVVQLAGIGHALHAIISARTPQSALGWSVSLILLPYITIPLYWIFGESKFAGYTQAGSGENRELDRMAARCRQSLGDSWDPFSEKYSDAERIARSLGKVGATGGNRVQLLVDGEDTFDAIFRVIGEARSYVVVQFYIIHDDGLGRKLKEVLLAAMARGVRCYVLYDSVGSKGLGEAWVGPLRAAGAKVNAFVTNRQMGKNFQVNFRNHRKLVVADGRVGFVGGVNAGDEYLGLGPLGPWRDTHLKVEGPAATAMMFPFLEDWYYAAGEVPEFDFAPRAAGSQRVLSIASGPAQTWHTAPGVYLEMIHDVRRRLWIASPYFVPDPAARLALAHAALRGVDVRILLPSRPDHLLPWLSSFTFYPQMKAAGVRIWRYGPGFMHQKVLLADEDLAVVGSINFDYRSFLINFEAAAIVEDRAFASQVEAMLEADFARSTEEDLSMFENGSFWFRLKCRMAALISPEQ